MCRDCGEFVPAVKRDGDWEPSPEECPDCGGEAFKRVEGDD